MPDTFQYRLIDTFGASDVATVTLSPPQGFTLSKTFIDIGHVRQGEARHGTPQHHRVRPTQAAPSPSNPSLRRRSRHCSSSTGRRTIHRRRSSIPDAFRPSRPNVEHGERGVDPLPRACQPAARARVRRPGRLQPTCSPARWLGSVVLVGESADPVTGQQHAVRRFGADRRRHSGHDRCRRPTTSVPVDSRCMRALASYCANYIEVIFDGAACVCVGGVDQLRPRSGTWRHHLHPPAGFTGTVTFPYASGDLPACWDNRLVLPGRDDAVLGTVDRRRRRRDAAKSRRDQGHPQSVRPRLRHRGRQRRYGRLPHRRRQPAATGRQCRWPDDGPDHDHRHAAGRPGVRACPERRAMLGLRPGGHVHVCARAQPG